MSHSGDSSPEVDDDRSTEELHAVTASLANTSITSAEVNPSSDISAPSARTDVTTEPSSAGLKNESESVAGSHSGRSSSYRREIAPGSNKAPVAKNDLPYRQQTFVERPGTTIQQSRLGRKLMVDANFFAIDVAHHVETFHYDIAYCEARTRKELFKREITKKLFWLAVADHPHIFPPKEQMVFNDVNMLWSLKQLKLKGGEQILKVQTGNDPRYSDEFLINIKYVNIAHFDPHPKDTVEKTALQQFVDLLVTMRLRCTPCLDSQYFVSHGHSMFYAPVPSEDAKGDSRLVVPLGRGLEAWTGLHGALKPDSQNGLLYNVDISHSVFFKQYFNLVKFYCEVIRRVPFHERRIEEHEAELHRVGMDRRNREQLNTALKGSTVLARYGNFQRSFKFGKVGEKAALAHTFDCDGIRISVCQYFFDKFGLKLRFPFLPCVQLGKKNNWVPMEFVFTHTDPFKFKGQIPEAQLGRMVRETAFEPLRRKQIIEKMAAANPEGQEDPVHLSGQDEFMKNFGVSINREFERIPATLLPVPKLQFGNDESFTDSEHHGVWEVAKPQFRKVKEPSKKKLVAAIIFIHNEQRADQNEVDLGGFSTLMRVLHEFGVEIPYGATPHTVERFSQFDNGGWGKLLSWMQQFKKSVIEKCEDHTPICLFVFPYRCTTRRQRRDDNYFSEYAMVKYICDVMVGVHSQCVLKDVYAKMNGNVNLCATAHNVALKVMGKIGAVHYTLESGGLHKNWTILTNPESPTLILGVDVTHPGEMDRNQGEHATLSVACVVGNIDLECVQYEQSVRVQAVGQERLVCMKEQLYQRISAFAKRNSVRPQHIVVYRDGVSETEFQNTLYEEKNSIRMACLDLDPEYNPTLTYIVVSKRHHTRFFPTKEEDCEGKAYNLKPGTLVETGVTTSTYFDFYLISQFGPLGTSRPTHYYVLWDDWKPSPAFWQTITHALTYTYVRCPKSISQPAPVMYAHLAAKRAKEYLMAYYHKEAANIARMSNYEKFVNVTRNLQRFEGLQGMIFV